jgi:hypothetical protein
VTDNLDPVQFGLSFQRFFEWLQQHAPVRSDSVLDARLTEHLGRPARGLPVVTDTFPLYDHANVQVGLDRYLAGEGRGADLVGIGGGGRDHHSLSEVVELTFHHRTFDVGAVDYVTVPVGVDREMTCVRLGILLIEDGPARLVAMVRASPHGRPEVLLEVLAEEPAVARAFLAGVRAEIERHNVFRGQVVSVEDHSFGHGVGPLRFHVRPEVDRADVILPVGALDSVERQVIGVATHRERLLAAGHHLKRGILLFGPPGTGKTHTVRYLMSRLPEVTVVVLTGLSLGYIREACALARLVQPTLVVVEDVDLIAESRSLRHGGDNPLLFQILNEMDGVAGDSDVAFVLTTNRADLIEPALAQRPGRIDLAVEVPLPDASARRRLLRLYGPRLELSEDEVEAVVAETEGMTGSFFAELSRRAELIAADYGGDHADAVAVGAALDELRASRAALANSAPAGPPLVSERL